MQDCVGNELSRRAPVDLSNIEQPCTSSHVIAHHVSQHGRWRMEGCFSHYALIALLVAAIVVVKQLFVLRVCTAGSSRRHFGRLLEEGCQQLKNRSYFVFFSSDLKAEKPFLQKQLNTATLHYEGRPGASDGGSGKEKKRQPCVLP